MSGLQFLSTTSVAKRWDCSPDLVRKLVREGVIQAIALTHGKRTAYRIALHVVEQYEARNARSLASVSTPLISAKALRFRNG
jgi:hypothetical protein